MQTITAEHRGKTQKLEVSEGLDATIGKANTFLVVGPGYYGYGESIKSARENCTKAGCPRKARMNAYLGDEKLGVDGMGRVSAGIVWICLGEV